MKKTLRQLESDLSRNNDERIEIKRLINEKKSNKYVTCEGNYAYGGGCGKRSKIKNTTYIQTHWYEAPYGCTGGAMWHEGEGQWLCKCGHRNRLYDKPEVEKLKYLFKEVVCEYDD